MIWLRYTGEHEWDLRDSESSDLEKPYHFLRTNNYTQNVTQADAAKLQRVYPDQFEIVEKPKNAPAEE